MRRATKSRRPGGSARLALFSPLALAVLAGCYTSEGSGEVALATYAVDGFTEVVLNGDGEATIVPGDYRVTASADSDVLLSVRVDRLGPRLVLGRDVDWIDGVRPTLPIDYRISMPTLAAVQTSGNGLIRVRNATSEADLRLAVFGTGTIDVAAATANRVTVEVDGSGVVSMSALQAHSVRVTVAGSGRVAADGSADDVAVEVVGSGLFRGSRLRASNANVQVTGAGQALVWPVERLEAHVNGTGRVAYLGDPVVQQTVRGEGQVAAAL